jgi:hypothetical protein
MSIIPAHNPYKIEPILIRFLKLFSNFGLVCSKKTENDQKIIDAKLVINKQSRFLFLSFLINKSSDKMNENVTIENPNKIHTVD